MAGVKISELNPTFQLNDDDVIPLARPGPGNGYTYKIYGSVFGKASDILALQNRATSLESRATNLESRATNVESRATDLESRATDLESSSTNLVATKVSLSGDTMTGFLTLNANPTNTLHAATKQYVDSAISGAVGALGKTWADFKCP